MYVCTMYAYMQTEEVPNWFNISQLVKQFLGFIDSESSLSYKNLTLAFFLIELKNAHTYSTEWISQTDFFLRKYFILSTSTCVLHVPST